MKKRILASLLSLLMVFSLTPTIAYATGLDEEVILAEAGTGEADEAETGSRCTLTEGCTLEAGHESDCVVGETAEEKAEPEEYAGEEIDDEALAETEITEDTGTTVLGSVPSVATGDSIALTSDGGSLSSGSYYLAADVQLTTDIIIPSNATVTIDLNGKTLTGTGSGSVITVEGILTLTDSSATEEEPYGTGKVTGGDAGTRGYGGGVNVNGGTFTLENGSISGNSAYFGYGGGVYVTGGTFNMESGNISGNSANYGYGGGVYVSGGTFNMYGGAISENTAYSGYGGGVYVTGGTFNMTDGVISGNGTSRDPVHYGGGVYVYDSTFTMTGGDITGNLVYGYGGGVYVSSGTFYMNEGSDGSSGTISGNSAGRGGGIELNNSSFTMNSGTISGNKATDSAWGGGGIYIVSSTFTMNSGTITGNIANGPGGGISLSAGNFGMTGGSITENTGSYFGGVYVQGTDSKFTMSGGSITKNTADSYSGGVYVAGASVSVSGTAVITDNTADGVTRNVYLPSRLFITIGGKLQSGASIGVTIGTAPTSDSAVQITTAETETFYYSYAPGYIFSDDTSYGVRANSTGKYLELYVPSDAISGTVTITGDAAYGQTLTAEVDTEIVGTLRYQWMRGTETITGAVGSTYTLTEDDIGNTITVVVSCNGYTGTLSATSGAVQKGTAAISISGTATKVYDGRAVSAPTVSVTLAGSDVYSGTPSVAWYQVTADGESLLDSAPSDVGNYKVVVTVSDAGDLYQTSSVSREFSITQAAQSISYATTEITKTVGDDAFIIQLTRTTVYGTVSYASSDTSVAAVDASSGKVTIVGAGTVTITATVPGSSNYTSASASYTLTVNLPDITGGVTITGNAVYGRTLTVSLSDTVPDGVIYQWMRGTEIIPGATGSTYTLTGDDIGENITVVVSHTGYKGTLSAASGVVQRATLTPSVSGTFTKVYDGTAEVTAAQGLSITLSGVLTADQDGVTASADYAYASANAGDSRITASNITLSGTAAGYYVLSADSVTVTGSITPKAISTDDFAVDTDDETYTGSVITKAINSILTEGTDYQVTYSGNISAGTAIVTIQGLNNYTGELTWEFTIEPRTLSAVLTGTVTKVYDGTTAIPDGSGLTLTLEDVVEVDKENVTVSAESITYEDVNVGTAKGLAVTGLTLSGSAAGNYQLDSTSLNVASAEGQFVITAADQDISYSATDVTRHITDSDFINDLTSTTVDGAISYTSDHPDVATVDADGLVTIVGAGTATITATAAATANYKEATASYTLTVTDHDYAAVVTEPTCTEQGYTTHTCSLCGDSYIDTYVEAHGHDWDYGVVTIAATCTEDGLRTYTCSICKYSDTEIIPATGHSLIYVGAKDATSTEEGNTEYWCCEACGEYFSDAAGTSEIAADSVVIPVSAAADGTATASAATGDSSLLRLCTAVALTGLLGMISVFAYRRRNSR